MLKVTKNMVTYKNEGRGDNHIMIRLTAKTEAELKQILDELIGMSKV
jgi:hypothetical protein